MPSHMPRTSVLPIMPKEIRTSRATYAPSVAPYPTPDFANTFPTRNTAIWSTGDDERLLQARAAESSWQLVAEKYFPGKTSNACRKRYERLVEKRNVEDWDSQKRGQLAQEYLKMRRELWEPLAVKLGVKWTVAEAKVALPLLSLIVEKLTSQQCMGMGLKQLQATARTADRKEAAGSSFAYDSQGISDHHSDSGIGLGSDAEMEVVEGTASPGKPSSWHVPNERQPSQSYQEHSRSRSLPQPLPLYQPPPPITTYPRSTYNTTMTASPESTSFGQQVPYQRYSPGAQNGRGGISIQSVLAPTETQARQS